ncbi:MAG TPA: glycosyltransferase [Candidatus Sulfotelmatobacter sp.]|nr:glycosyltransferase [Candidatus Sulfotelmatobacter sp.]
MKICLVTTFPPSTGGLSEYGFHIARELQRNPFLNLTVLADQLPHDHIEPEGFNVVRCWSFDDPMTVVRILRAIRKLKPDVVWFNLLFSTFGRNPVIAFSGLMAPLLARLGGRYTHVTLHHLMDTVELKDVGVRHENLYRAAGEIATRMILLSNSVSVLMPGYRKILNDKYGRDNVHLRAHGLLARRPEFPDLSRRGNPVRRVLAFGKWGTYKRLELMTEAFNVLTLKMPDARLVVAGGDHPQAAGYIESMKRQHVGNPRIEFRGYIPESDLADLFQSSSVAVMPYSSSTGCSGVAHLACAFGVPIVSADLADFRQMAQSEELAIEFYPSGNAQGLADCLLRLLNDIEKQGAMATQNFSAALRMTMPNVVQKYLRHFELQQRVQTLRHISRFRRLPSWVPSKSLMLRFMTRNSLNWSRRSVILHSPWSELSPDTLLNHNGNGRGKRSSSCVPVDRDDVRADGGCAAGRNGSVNTARYSTDSRDGQNAGAQGPNQTTAVKLTNDDKSNQTETEDPGSEKESLSWVVVSGSGSRGYGKDGTRGTRAGDDETGGK